MLRKILLSVFGFALLAGSAWARTTDTGKPVVEVRDADLTSASDVTWTPDNVYNLKEFVFLESGGKLTIRPGTIVKGDTGRQANAKALIISRGAKIIAQGTKVDPIIFTTILDTVDSQTDLVVDDRGLWGGLIILGKARVSDGVDLEDAIEGIPLVAGLPDPRALYGATGGDTTTYDQNDSSGVLSYVSIRHGGSVLEANNEINGLTLGGIGSKTFFDYIEVFGNADDDIEFFGGVPNVKHTVASYSDDDGWDTDEGYRGKLQFGVRLMSDLVGNNGSENDGAENQPTTPPFTRPDWYNLTIIGSGVGAANLLNDRAFLWRDNAGMNLRNSIITQIDENVILIPVFPTTPSDSTSIDTSLVIRDNIWWTFGCAAAGVLGNAACVSATAPRQASLRDYLTNAGVWAGNDSNNDEVDPLLEAVGRPHSYNARVFAPRPKPGSPANSGYPDPSLADPWFTSVSFAGALSPDTTTELGTWHCGWTALAQYGFLKERRGDLNGDGNFSSADLGVMILTVFVPLSNPTNRCRSDVDCNGILSASDVSQELLLVFIPGYKLPCL